MALYGVLGDIHGNREALEVALAWFDARGAHRVVCVGDIVGYNADAEECVAMLRQRGVPSIAGNHDLIGVRMLGFERCSNKAMHALERTRRTLSPESAAYLRALPAHHVIDGRVLLTHGGVRDVQQYMTQPKHIRENVAYLREDFPGVRICFFGHTHEQRVFEVDGVDVDEPFAPALAAATAPRAIRLDPRREYFINPGSVDASRKRTAKVAEAAIFDIEALRVEFAQLPYDAHATEIRAAANGYRIDRWRDRVYEIRRRLIGPRQEEQEAG